MSVTIELFVANDDPKYKDLRDSENDGLDRIEEFQFIKPRFKNKRFGKYLYFIDHIFRDYIIYQEKTPGVGTYKVLPLKCIAYRQGWYFTKELLRSNNVTIYYAFYKHDVFRLLNRFVDKSDERGLEAYQLFKTMLNKFSDEDHFIFRIAF